MFPALRRHTVQHFASWEKYAKLLTLSTWLSFLGKYKIVGHHILHT